jgi:hypothetical protein
MATKLDPSEIVSFKELLLAVVFIDVQNEVFHRALKGLLFPEDIFLIWY